MDIVKGQERGGESVRLNYERHEIAAGAWRTSSEILRRL